MEDGKQKIFMPRDEYVDLLKEYAFDGKLIKLIHEAILDADRAREEHFINTGNYPDNRNLLRKLELDLNMVLTQLKSREMMTDEERRIIEEAERRG